MVCFNRDKCDMDSDDNMFNKYKDRYDNQHNDNNNSNNVRS